MTRDIQDQACRFLLKREDGDWTDADEMALAAWLAESAAHKAAFWRLEHGWREADRMRALGRDAWSTTIPALHPTPPLWRRALPIAASILLVILGTAFIPRGGPAPAHVEYATRIGEYRQIELRDGSTAELNTNTSIAWDTDRDYRRVRINRGEAFFSVVHMSGAPFTVEAGPRRVVVLGTKFSVQNEAGKIRVAVLEGRVRFENIVEGRNGPLYLERGDVATFSGHSTLITYGGVDAVANGLSWRTGTLTFRRTRLDAAAREFNRYNTTRIEIADPATAALKIGGSFKVNGAQSFADLLATAYGLRVSHQAERIIISASR